MNKVKCVSSANVERTVTLKLVIRSTGSNVGQDRNSIVTLTHSLITTTCEASPPIESLATKTNI